ncbi:hypothetical protein P8V03_05695 [Clostridium sp. A1-XYC3]|uniref:Transmembrane protein n=1 Tax=Clostridium tanneri TaxID=3037988 RepID=A0ABU4JRS3_9CLOT|nr:hypothetical protein [Clostridium sp. A1-XYC3]MDW8800648.1 hypothetical protein [Clostridium sp. A1-XYC3]
MNIDKAIRKQKKSYKRFLLSMGFIFFVLPAALIFYKKIHIFYILYLMVLELLIILALFISINNEMLRFNYDGYRLKLILGLGKKRLNLTANNIVLVHVENIDVQENAEEDFRIILLSTSKFRSNRMIPVNLVFLRNHPYVAYCYNRIKTLHPNDQYYFTIIKKGGIKKYPLLDTIYKTCVYAYFTEDTIEKIKFYRENSEYYN